MDKFVDTKQDASSANLLYSGASRTSETVYAVMNYDEQGCLFHKLKIHGPRVRGFNPSVWFVACKVKIWVYDLWFKM